MKLNHPNIIRVFETWETSTHYILVMEYCEGGDLFDEVASWETMQEEKAIIVMR